MTVSSGPFGRTSGRHRTRKNRSLELQNFILRVRRARRVCRPHLVVLARLLIVLFSVIELKPTEAHFDDDFWPSISRLNDILGIVAAVLAVIYFDTRIFNFVVVGSILIEFLFDMHSRERYCVPGLIAWMTFHCTAVLFSAFVGRRRSIIQPQVLKCVQAGGYYLANIRNLRNVDILEVGIRLQVSILTIDYSLTSPVGATGFVFTLPFVLLFLVGYSTQKNGIVVLLLLLFYSTTNETSPILRFNFIKCISTLSVASLSLSVGPGALAIDEWLATKKQLCY